MDTRPGAPQHYRWPPEGSVPPSAVRPAPRPAQRDQAPRWRWVAHSPFAPPLPGTPPPVPRSRTGPAHDDRTPAYGATPRWGLPPLVRRSGPAPATVRRGPGPLTRHARAVLRSAAGWSLVAGLAHLLRYGVLAAYADRIAPDRLEVMTVLGVWVTALGATLTALLALLATAGWLVERRRTAFAPHPDPRGPWSIRLGCWVPVVSLIGPVVLIRELELARPVDGLERPLRLFWLCWVVDWLLVAVSLALLGVEGPQAAADRVLVTAAAFVAAGLTAWSALGVMRCFDATSPRFTRRYLLAGIVEGHAPGSE